MKQWACHISLYDKTQQLLVCENTVNDGILFSIFSVFGHLLSIGGDGGAVGDAWVEAVGALALTWRCDTRLITAAQLDLPGGDGSEWAAQPVTLHVKLPHMQHQRHDKNACFRSPFNPVCSCLFYIHFSSASAYIPLTSLPLSCLFFKGTWQRETVWLQSITWWRSVTLGCPVSKMMACTLQREDSDRSLSNGQLLKPWTMVCHNFHCPAVTARTIFALSLCQQSIKNWQSPVCALVNAAPWWRFQVVIPHRVMCGALVFYCGRPSPWEWRPTQAWPTNRHETRWREVKTHIRPSEISREYVWVQNFEKNVAHWFWH